jgi:hypothetical protein
MQFEAAFHLYPQARFVLTERPGESWRASLADHFQRFQGEATFDGLRNGAGASE